MVCLGRVFPTDADVLFFVWDQWRLYVENLALFAISCPPEFTCCTCPPAAIVVVCTSVWSDSLGYPFDSVTQHIRRANFSTRIALTHPVYVVNDNHDRQRPQL